MGGTLSCRFLLLLRTNFLRIMYPITFLSKQPVRFLLSAFIFCLLQFPAYSQRDVTVQPGKNGKRIALVLGNAAYQNQTTLYNTVQDADSMAQALRACGFEVLSYKNANLAQMDRCITELNNKLRQTTYEAAVFYYSGHGLQVEGDNYLVPVDARLAEKYDVKYQTLPAQRILDMMEACKVSTKILLLDACRDNPFSRGWRSAGSEYEQGLAGMSAPEGTFIGFAASPGKQSSDGGALGNGVYTKAILKHIRTPGLTIDELFTRVAATTRQLIGQLSGTQIPFKNSSLMANFYFLPPNFGGKNEAPDRDGDGVPDKTDICPDRVGPASNAGCPILDKVDSDGDGLEDEKDDCPEEYGTLRGCPDTDRDGVADKDDNCPYEKGLVSLKGCPVSDRDNDGVSDTVDKCPDVAGEKDWAGCPDSDDDGIPDHKDDCPYVKGIASRKGCPDLTQPSKAETIIDPTVGTFMLVKGGTFQMGGPSDGPIHSVTVSDYYIGQTEVTQAQWRAVMGENPSRFKDCDNCPVEQVSWEDIQTFIAKLNNRSGGSKFRLPTEAEWEYAARGGKQSKGYTYSGSNDIDAVAWYSKNFDDKTHPVKGKAANELGLYDMSGNVWEWCSDWYGSYSAASQTNPTGATSGSYRVYRGGSWHNDPESCVVADRAGNTPDYRGFNLGFRLARAVTF